MFVSDLCRSIWVDFEEEVKVQGLKAYRYRPPKDVFDMGNPDNFCYCPDFLECACPSRNFTGNFYLFEANNNYVENFIIVRKI